MTANIIQRGKVLSCWSVRNAKQVTDKIEKQADSIASLMVKRGRMESGYYDLEVRNGGQILDSTIQIA